jgi:PTS system galactitol-specific IIA component
MSAVAGITNLRFFAKLTEATDKEVIARLAKELGDDVAPTFAAAALAREKRSPTGLPFGDVGVAIPHAEPEHVKTPAIVIASLAAPVSFRMMGSPKTVVPVTLVVMPALSAKEQAAAGLTSIIELLQNADIRAALVRAQTADQLRAGVVTANPT